MTTTKFTSSQIAASLQKICQLYNLESQYLMSTSGEFLVKTLTKGKRTFLVKIRKMKSPYYQQRFENEIAVNHFIKKLDLPFLRTPVFLKSDNKQQPEYLLYEFIKAPPLNTYYFYVGARQANNLIGSNFLETITTLQKKYSSHNLNLKLPRYRFAENFSLYQRYEKILKPYLKPKELKQARRLLTANRYYFNQAPLVFTHGDLNPKNIIIKNKKSTIIDWSDVQLNNPLFDYCSLYLYAWNLPLVMGAIKNFILKKYDYLDNANRLYLLNRLILTPKIIKITKDSILGLAEDKKNKIILAQTERDLKAKAEEAIEQHLKTFKRLIRHLELWQKPTPVVRSMEIFMNTSLVDKFLRKEKKRMKLKFAWQQLHILNKRLAIRSSDQKLINQIELIGKGGQKSYIMAKIRMERGDDLARQSYQVLAAIWHSRLGRTLISRPLGYYPRHHLFLYEKVLGKSLASRLEKNNIDTKKILPKFIKQAGKILAILHKIPITNFTQVKLVNNYDVNEQIKWLEFYLNKVPALKSKKNTQAAGQLKKLNQHTKRIKIKKSFIHGDYQLQNLIIKNDRSRIKLIDFDNAEINDPLIDVGNFIYQIKYKNIIKRGVNDLRQMFLDSYLKNSPHLNKTNFNERINLYIIMAIVKNINFNCLNGDYDLAVYDIKIVRHLLKLINKPPIINLRSCERLKP